MAPSSETREIRATRPSAPRDFRSDYAEYLQTPGWRKRRDIALRAAAWTCERCGSKRNPQVHHRTYAHVGAELPGDLEVLCRACHEGEHLEQDQREHAGVYVALVSSVLKSSERFESFADLIDAVKDACRAARLPYKQEHVWNAVRDLDAKRKGVLDAPERRIDVAPARDERPIGRGEAASLLQTLGLKVGVREMPRLAQPLDPDAVNRFRQECGLWR